MNRENTIESLSLRLRNREISSVELTKQYLDSIRESDKSYNAYLRFCEDIALAQAEEADRRLRSGENVTPLTGIPYGMKDNICTKGSITSCASKMLENFVPVYDAFVTELLNNSGAVMLGKTNMDEFAMGSSTENSAFAVVHNPRGTDRVPGGSSGGSAACVAADEAVFAIGSDTGGSIRQPASFCGVVGMKPTYGSVSRNGLVAFASSLDQIGPLTKTVRDSAIVLNAIHGHDEKDSTSIDREYEDCLSMIEAGVRGMKIALPREYFGEGISDDVKACVLAAAEVYKSLGAQVEEISIPSLDYALPAYYVISSAEASSNLSRFDGVRYGYRTAEFEDITELYKKTRAEGFGEEVKRRIMLGCFALSSGYYDAYYKKALQVRTLIQKHINAVFEKYSFILAPVAPTTAYKIGEMTSDPLEMYLGDIYTVPVNIAGVPSLSMPCGVGADGMPVGMQLIGRAFDEKTLYAAGNAFEREMGTFEDMAGRREES